MKAHFFPSWADICSIFVQGWTWYEAVDFAHLHWNRLFLPELLGYNPRTWPGFIDFELHQSGRM
jgi:hypothetical protein